MLISWARLKIFFEFRIWSNDVLCEIVAWEVISVPQTYLVYGIIDGLDTQLSHSPDLLQLAVDHHHVRVRLHFGLLGKGRLLSFVRDQEGDWLFEVFQGQLLDLGENIRRLTAVQENDDASVFGGLA